MLATIGRSRAVAKLGGMRISGFAAWLPWCFAHIYFLIRFRNHLIVMLNWAWNFVTFQCGSRLITGIVGAQIKDLKQTRKRAHRGTRREVPGPALSRP